MRERGLELRRREHDLAILQRGERGRDVIQRAQRLAARIHDERGGEHLARAVRIVLRELRASANLEVLPLTDRGVRLARCGTWRGCRRRRTLEPIRRLLW